MLSQSQKPTILKLTRLALTNGNTSQYQSEVKQLDDVERAILKSMKTVYAKSQYHVRLAKGTNKTKHKNTNTGEASSVSIAPLDDVPTDENIAFGITPLYDMPNDENIASTTPLECISNDDYEHIDAITQPEDKTYTYDGLRTKIPLDIYERLNKLTVMLLKADGDCKADRTNEQLKMFYDSIMEKHEVVIIKAYDAFKLYKQRDNYTTTDSDVEMEKDLCSTLSIPFVNDKKKLRRKKKKRDRT